MGKSSPSAPPPPDYGAAARATADGNLNAARYATQANRPNEYTPLGSRTWTNNPTYDDAGYQNLLAQHNAGIAAGYSGTAPSREDFFRGDNWTSQINLTPEGQGLFDQQLRISQNLGDVSEAGLDRVGQAMAQPFDMSRVPAAPGSNEASRNAVVQALLGRQQPGLDRAREAREAALITQGHNRGGTAWNSTQDDLNRQQNDLRMAAELAGGQEQSRLYGIGSDARAKAIQEQAYLRSLPLSELNALRTGSQVSMPQFGAYGQQGQTTGANMAGAAQAQGQWDQGLFNQQQAAQNANTAGLYGLGAAGIGGAAMSAGTWMPYLMALSDRRLKSNIVRVGALSSGLPVYEYDIGGQRTIGVMADEVAALRPEAVFVAPNGYAAVRYDLL